KRSFFRGDDIMPIRKFVTVLLLGGAVLAAQLAQAQDFFIKDGDRIVMMGDSITEQHLYSNFVEMWTVTRFPAWKLTFRNVGIGGDRSVGGNSRFQRDVERFHPNATTVDFARNAARSKALDAKLFKSYSDCLQVLTG